MNTRLDRWFVPLLVACLAGAPVPGAPQEGTSRGFVLEAGDHDIAGIISTAATFLGRNFIVQPQELAGSRDNTITLQKSLNLDVSGCEEVVSQFAWMKGLVMSPVDPRRGIYEFINVRGPRQGEISATFLLPEQITRRPQLKILVSTTLRLEHIDAQRASQYLRPLLTTSGRSSGISLSLGSLSRHALILRGLTDQVANAIDLLSKADVPEAAADMPGVEDRLAALERERDQLRAELAALRKKLTDLEAKRR